MRLLSPGNQHPPSHLRGFSKVTSFDINSVVVERGLLRITRHPFHLYGSEAISGSEEKKPNIITKMFPLLLLFGKF